MKELIIIGAGPAGLTAAIYGMRTGLDLLMVEKFAPGGQILNTEEVENYPGFVEPIMGYQLVDAMQAQAARFGVETVNEEITKIETADDGHFILHLASGKTLESKSVIAANGSSYKKLQVPGESELTGRGVSYCATCDGAFFKEKTVAVIGGGSTALEESVLLTKFASKVYLIHRRDEFRGEMILQNRVKNNDKIEPILNTTVKSINGEDKVTSVTLLNKKINEENNLELDGVFIFIGYNANTGLYPDSIKNEYKQIKVNLNMETDIPGFFAAGDLREFSKRQIVMSCSDGAIAAMSAYEYVSNKEL